MNIAAHIDILKKAPDLLEELISEIPTAILKKRRKTGKWSIHEHACHLCESQKMMIERFKVFKFTTNPRFDPYLPGTAETPDDVLLHMDLQSSLQIFRKDRKKLIDLLHAFDENDWNKEAIHPEYIKFTPAIFLRHIVMHDHFHMYRIEELWLTTDAYL